MDADQPQGKPEPERQPTRLTPERPKPKTPLSYRSTGPAPPPPTPGTETSAAPTDPFWLPPTPPAPAPPPPPRAAPVLPARTLPLSWLPWLVLAVPVSSVLGLARLAMSEGWGVVGQTWASSPLADGLFVAGTVVAVWLSAFLVLGRQPKASRLVGAALVALACHGVLYILCWWLAGPGTGRPFAGAGTAFQVLGGGVLGLAAMTFAGPLIGLFLPRVPQGRPSARGA